MRAYIELCIDNDPSTSHPTIRIEMPVACNTLDSVYQNLIRPALEASGFSNVDEFFDEFFVESES